MANGNVIKLAPILCLLALAACQTDGRPPLNAKYELNGTAARTFADYLTNPKYPRNKAFALEPKSNKTWMAWFFWTPEEAIDWTLDKCKKVTGRACQLYAVNDQIVSGQSIQAVKASLKTRFPTLTQQALRNYMDEADFGHFKAFAMDLDGGNWGRAWGQPTPRLAAERALNDCNLPAGRGCRVYAFGKRVLSDGSEASVTEAAKSYARAVLAEPDRAGNLAARWQGRVTASGIEPEAAQGPHDGDWAGEMRCAGTSINPEPFTKKVAVKISDGVFDLVPDTSYSGSGIVDRRGRVSVRWKPQDLAPYLGTRDLRIFRFDGTFRGAVATLKGRRGPRQCEITLARS